MRRVLNAIAVTATLLAGSAHAARLTGDNAAFVAKLAGGLYATIYCGDTYEMDSNGLVEWADGRGVDAVYLLPKFVAGASAFVGRPYDRKDINPKVTRLIRKVFDNLDDLSRRNGKDESCRSLLGEEMFEHFIRKKGSAL
ncbi:MULTISPECIES: hypothetical protein [Bradyrhizobium]|uniref:hypothetical protein n=1 Tax=Bradyrhizobium TaxID=374 RepID=UPI000B20FC5B|nr:MULTISPECIES: hypothetical protein [Bradyrhizobium]